MPRAATKPKADAAVCGADAEDGQHCNLPKGHEGAHTYVASTRTDPALTEIDAEFDSAETTAEAAARILEDDRAKRPVIVKLARIMASIGEIKPAGRNTHFNYAFIKDTQVSGLTRARMAKERLMVIPEVLEESWVETKTARGGISWVTKLKVRFTVIDGDSGDEVTGVGFGYGDDSGDKGANKALTAAMKYWLIKLFQIGGENDLENDERTDQRSADRQAGSTADTGVQVQGREITGVARGGRSDKMTATQKRQIFAIYKDLELTPESFVGRVDAILGDKLVIPEDSDPQTALNNYLNNLDGDDAGKLLAGLDEEKDAKAADQEQSALDASGPYG